MLQAIREKTSGIIAYAIIGLISIPFVLMGINSYFGGGKQAPAATVNGKDIGVRQLDYAFANYQQRLRSIFGGKIPEAFNNEAMLKEQVRSQLINEEVLAQYIESNKFRIGNDVLNQKIVNMKVFQQNGRFDQETYKAQLKSQGLVPIQFEEDMRRSEEQAQIQKAITHTGFSSHEQQVEKNELKNQQRHIRSMILPLDTKSVSISADDLKNEYEKNASQYKTPDRVKVDYIELNVDLLKRTIQISDKQLKDYYEQVKQDLGTPEVRQTRHILFTVAKDADEAEVAKKKQLAEQIKAKLDAGEDFATLAKKYSEDPGSASEGGDLGEVEKGMMDEKFEKALFSMAEGQVSEPVRTSFGWHIIKLEKISGGEIPSFASVKAKLQDQLQTEQAENKIYELAEQLSNITYEQPDSLIPASEQLGLKIQTTDWFTRLQGSGLASDEKVRAAAYSADVLKEGRNSETIELGDNHVVVLHLNTHQKSTLPPMADIKPSLEKSIRLKKARANNLELGKKLLAQAQSNNDLAKIAKQQNVDLTDSGFIDRSNTSLTPNVRDFAFRMKKPSTGAVEVSGIQLASGDYAIVEVSEVKVVKGDGKETKTPVGGQQNYDYQAWLADQVERAEIVKTPLSELQ